MSPTVAERDGLPVTITAGGGGARGFAVDIEGIAWRTIPAVRQGSDQGAGPGEQSLSSDVVWRRSRDNWILGAGQEYADLIEESDVLRFRSSDGINPWGVRELKPLPATALRRTSVNTNLKCISMQVGVDPYFVIVDGTSVLYSLDPSLTSPSFTAHTGLAGTMTSITTDGRRWWAGNGTDIYVGTPGTVGATVFSTYNAGMVGYANGRLLAANGAELVEISAAGAATVIFTHPNSNFVWAGVASSPGGIYAFGNLGSEPEIYVITAIDTTGALDVPFIAADLPNGELIRCMESYAGVMLLGTSRGVRLALVTGGGFLSYGPVIEDVYDVQDFASRGEDIWVAGKSAYLDPNTAVNGLTRVRLSRFTADLVPAFAEDLKARGTVSGTVLTTCYHNGFMYFGISGRGFYGEHITDQVVTSTIDLGWFTYGVSEEKMLDSLTIWCDALPASCSIVADVYPEDSSTSLLTLTMNTPGQTKQTGTYSGTMAAERLRVVLTLTAPAVADLVVRRVTLRGTPRPFVAEEVTLPLILTTAARDATATELGLDVWEEWTVLHDLMADRTRCTVSVGEHQFFGRIEAIQVESGGLGGGNGLNGFDDQFRFLEGVWQVTFLTLEPAG